MAAVHRESMAARTHRWRADHQHRSCARWVGRTHTDNALAETINGLYKAEVIHRRAPWKSREAVELATLEWVAWFNNHRLMAALDYVPPAEFEANYYRNLEQQIIPV